MKTLLILVLLAASALLYFKDRNDQAQIATLQAQNDELSQQLTQKQQAFTRMQAQVQQAQVQAQVQNENNARAVAPLGTGGLNQRPQPLTDDSPLSQPAHRSR